jgi:hypothetical protein
MRITTDRTERVVEVYELPTSCARAPTPSSWPRPRNGRRSRGGARPKEDWVVVDRDEDYIEIAAAAYRDAKAAVERAEARAKALVVEESATRDRSEHQLAALLGVDRITIRRWRGKA